MRYKLIINEILSSEIKTIYDRLLPLLKENWAEIGEVAGGKSLSVDMNLIEELAKKGIYIPFVLKYKDEYIGYCSWVISKGVHSSKELYASTDTMFVSRRYRNTLLGAGLKLLKYSERVLKYKYKINILQFNMNMNFDLSLVLKRIGYKESEIIFNKRIN